MEKLDFKLYFHDVITIKAHSLKFFSVQTTTTICCVQENTLLFMRKLKNNENRNELDTPSRFSII